MQVSDIDIVQIAEEYPIGKKDHGPEFLLESSWRSHEQLANLAPP